MSDYYPTFVENEQSRRQGRSRNHFITPEEFAAESVKIFRKHRFLASLLTDYPLRIFLLASTSLNQRSAQLRGA